MSQYFPLLRGSGFDWSIKGAVKVYKISESSSFNYGARKVQLPLQVIHRWNKHKLNPAWHSAHIGNVWEKAAKASGTQWSIMNGGARYAIELKNRLSLPRWGHFFPLSLTTNAWKLPSSQQTCVCFVIKELLQGNNKVSSPPHRRYPPACCAKMMMMRSV